ncbi:16585_t:CDS:2 [Cetraspora pellucida]|uniref:16585_t:CDS:1 n=1 Tax=Cetraspora pellucida TaxID=1433469 RepID=A0A9N9K5M8_9GLOM|nr:16585_t:CDS:2 [Cetraspora pellucida]
MTNNSLPNRPKQFKQLDNEFDIALWLAHYKRILDLATNIRNRMMTRIDKVSDATSISTLSHKPVSKLLKIDQKECKALFLRTRNNSNLLYEELIVRVCKIAKSDHRLGSLIKDVGRWYNTYHYKFHVAAVRLANEFRSTNKSAKEPYDELDGFVFNKVWKQLLQMHLKATDLAKLKKDSETFKKLGVFVYQVIKTILIAQDNNKDPQNAIRKCDEYTINLKILTRLEIVKSLAMRELLDY